MPSTLLLGKLALVTGEFETDESFKKFWNLGEAKKKKNDLKVEKIKKNGNFWRLLLEKGFRLGSAVLQLFKLNMFLKIT